MLNSEANFKQTDDVSTLWVLSHNEAVAVNLMAFCHKIIMCEEEDKVEIAAIVWHVDFLIPSYITA